MKTWPNRVEIGTVDFRDLDFFTAADYLIELLTCPRVFAFRIAFLQSLASRANASPPAVDVSQIIARLRTNELVSTIFSYNDDFSPLLPLTNSVDALLIAYDACSEYLSGHFEQEPTIEELRARPDYNELVALFSSTGFVRSEKDFPVQLTQRALPSIKRLSELEFSLGGHGNSNARNFGCVVLDMGTTQERVEIRLPSEQLDQAVYGIVWLSWSMDGGKSISKFVPFSVCAESRQLQITVGRHELPPGITNLATPEYCCDKESILDLMTDEWLQELKSRRLMKTDSGFAKRIGQLEIDYNERHGKND